MRAAALAALQTAPGREASARAEGSRRLEAIVATTPEALAVDAQGRATGLVVHQYGADVPGKRID